MKTYKNLETYQLAFNLAINIYNLNISLPRQLLIRYGNRLRWSSLKTKDMIVEAYANGNTNTPDGKTLEDAANLCNEIISHLINIKAAYQRGGSVEKLIIGYQTLQFKIAKSRRKMEGMFPHTVPSPEGLGNSLGNSLGNPETPPTRPALKGWEIQDWEVHEPSAQYKQVS
ncbi:MAG: hypothetical protein GXO89_07715 [Chlorobi bacterium]|nr:hypothetical protein [Chlorobiota bacterium]